MQRQVQIPILSANWKVQAHQFGAVRKRCLHGDLIQQVGHAGKYLIATQHLATLVHGVCDGEAIPRKFLDLRTDESHGLGMVEENTPGESLLGKVPSLVQQETLEFFRRQPHPFSFGGREETMKQPPLEKFARVVRCDECHSAQINRDTFPTMQRNLISQLMSAPTPLSEASRFLG